MFLKVELWVFKRDTNAQTTLRPTLRRFDVCAQIASFHKSVLDATQWNIVDAEKRRETKEATR